MSGLSTQLGPSTDDIYNSTLEILGAGSFSFMIRDRKLSLPLYYDTAKNMTDLSIILLFVRKHHIYRALGVDFS
jgi:hypothetical protein